MRSFGNLLPSHIEVKRKHGTIIPRATPIFSVFSFFSFSIPPIRFLTVSLTGASAEEKLEIHGSTDCVTKLLMHMTETNMNSLIPMLASEETSTSEHVSCLSEPSFLADVTLQ